MGNDLDGVLQCGAYFPGTVLDIFRAADANRDGIVSGKEAVDFFMSTGLKQSNLSQVWEAATGSQPGGLTPAQFSRALRLVSLLQVPCVFSKEFVDKALHPTTGLQLPTPKIGKQFLDSVPEDTTAQPEGTRQKPAATTNAAGPKTPGAGSPPRPTQKPSSSSRAPQPQSKSKSTSSLPASISHQITAKPESQVSAPTSIDGPPTPEGSKSSADDDEAALTANSVRRHAPANTLRLDVRLQPHVDAAAAPLQRLCAAQELLLAAPTRAGGIMCFARAEYKPSEPTADWPLVRNGEDPMSAQGRECLPERVQASAVTTMHVCPYTEMLVSGHKDGTAIVWHVSASRGAGDPPMQQRLLLRAHSRSAVAAALTTAWGALWTAGSSGSLRWWPTAMAEAQRAPQGTALDHRPLPQCELRRATGERAHATVASLQLTSGGQIVVAASRIRATLWDAFSGRFLGVLAVSGCPLDTTHLIDPGAGVALDPATSRAVAGPEGPLPVLGSSAEDMLPGEEAARLAHRLNTVAMTTSSIAKKGFSGMKSIVSRQISKGREALMAPPLGQAAPGVGRECPPPPTDEAGDGDSDGDDQQQAVHTARRLFIVCTADNCIWSVSELGVAEVFAASGKQEGRFEAAFASAVCCAAAFGSLVWLGLRSGRVVAIDARTRARVATQDLHDSAVTSLQQVGLTMYALSASGAISGINACVLPKALPTGTAHPGHAFWQGCWRRAVDSWAARAADSVESVAVGLRVATWNVGEGRPGRESIRKVLGVAKGMDRELSVEGIDILVVGLQEIEMGTASVAVGAVKEVMGKRVAEQANHNARWWVDEMAACLDQGSGPHRRSWERTAVRQMSGLLLCVFARRAMGANVTNVATGVVACGVGGFGGNKGAVVTSFQLYGRRVLFLNSHFAAHQGAVRKRNADYRAIIRRLALPHQPALVATENPADEPIPGPAGVYSMPATARGAELSASPERRDFSLPNPGELPRVTTGDSGGGPLPERPDVAAIGFRTASMTVWCGDFNYRIDVERNDVVAAITGGTMDTLKAFDQARQQMCAGAIFHGMREAPLAFAPTYKFDKGSPDPYAYDSSEKRRIPAWTDRVFFKGSIPFPRIDTAGTEVDLTDTSPYPTAGVTRESPDQLLVRCTRYSCLPDVCDSDHKPVIARLRADVPNTDHKRRRRHVGKVLSEFHNEVTASLAPHVRLPSATLAIPGDSATLDSATLTISNDGHGDGTFLFRGWGLPSGAEAPPGAQDYVLPPWLSVFPNLGVVPAGGSVDVRVAVNRMRACYANESDSQRKTMHVNLYMVVNGLRQGGVSTAATNILKLQVTFKNSMQYA